MYQVGGSLQANAPSYVKRLADRELYQALKVGKFCYVLNSRQMGKSSLKVQVIQQLEAEGVACASVDVTEIGTQGVNVQQWYGALIQRLAQRFDLGDFDRRSWLQERVDIPMVQNFGDFVETILLARTTGAIVIFLDEIDSTLRLPFKDDFFAVLRAFENKRSEHPSFLRLTWCLIGVTTPSDLIKDPLRTPFNIAQGIELKGFELEDCGALIAGLRSTAGEACLAEILRWTGGQPFLTQKVCALANEESAIVPGPAWVTQLVGTKVIEQWESQDTPEHLRTLRDRLLSGDVDRRLRLLGLYRQILQQGAIDAEESADQRELRLTGLVVKRGGKLAVYNPIYQKVFGEAWVAQAMANLRPYGESMQAWLESDKSDVAYLLTGTALASALAWSQDKRLEDQDYRFLSASQSAENEAKLALERRANEILKAAEKRAKQRGLVGIGILTLSLLGAVGISWKTYTERDYIRKVSEIERLAAGATKSFETDPLDSLVSAMEAGQELRKIVPNLQDLSTYPTYAPLESLGKILPEIKEFNRLKFFGTLSESVPVSQDGKMFATIEENDKVKVWGEDGILLHELNGGGSTSLRCSTEYCERTSKVRNEGFGGSKANYINRVVFGANDDVIAASRANGILVWNTDGKLLYDIPVNDGFVTGMSLDTRKFLVVTHRALSKPEGWQEVVSVYDLAEDYTHPSLKIAGLPILPKQVAQFSLPQDYSTIGFSARLINVNGKQRISVGIAVQEENHRSDSFIGLWNLAGERLEDLYYRTNDGIAKIGGQIIENKYQFFPQMDNQGEVALGTEKSIYILHPNIPGVQVLRGNSTEEFQSGSYELKYSDFSRGPLVIKDGSGKFYSPLLLSSQHLGKYPYNWTKRMYKNSLGEIPKDEWNGSVLHSINQDANGIVHYSFRLALEDKVQPLVDYGAPSLNKQNSHSEYTQSKFSPDGKLVVAIQDTSVKLWQLDGKSLGEILIEGQFISMKFSPNSQFLAIETEKAGNIATTIWSVANQKPHKISTEITRQRRALAFALDGKSILADLSTKLSGDELFVGVRQELFVGMSQDGHFWVTSDYDKGIVYLRSIDGKETIKLQTTPYLAIRPEVFVSSDRKLIALAHDKGGEIRLFDTNGNHKILRKGSEKNGGIDQIEMRFSGDNKIFSTANGGKISRWNTNGDLIYERNGLNANDINPDGKILVANNSGLALYAAGNLDDLLIRGCSHLRIYLNSHLEVQKRLPICQDPAIRNHPSYAPSPKSPDPKARS